MKTTFDIYTKGIDLRTGILGGMDDSLDYNDDFTWIGNFYNW